MSNVDVGMVFNADFAEQHRRLHGIRRMKAVSRRTEMAAVIHSQPPPIGSHCPRAIHYFRSKRKLHSHPKSILRSDIAAVRAERASGASARGPSS